MIDNVNIGTIQQNRITSQSGQLSVADGVKLANKRLHTLPWRLHSNLSTEVFEKETEIMMENCYFLRDLTTLILKVHEKGAFLVGFEESKTFIAAARVIKNMISLTSDSSIPLKRAIRHKK